jgi:hypothetical protein
MQAIQDQVARDTGGAHGNFKSSIFEEIRLCSSRIPATAYPILKLLRKTLTRREEVTERGMQECFQLT